MYVTHFEHTTPTAPFFFNHSNLVLRRTVSSSYSWFYAFDGSSQTWHLSPSLARLKHLFLNPNLPFLKNIVTNKPPVLWETPWQNIFQIPLGHEVHFSSSNASLPLRKKYDPLDFLRCETSSNNASILTRNKLFLSSTNTSCHELGDHLKVRLENTLTRLLKPYKRIAIMAGGGLDSSVLLALLVARLRGASLKEIATIALHMEGPGDDRPYFKDLCAHLNLVPLRIYPEDTGKHMQSSLVLDANLYPVPSGAWEYAAGLLAKEQGAECILTGAGGDELFFEPKPSWKSRQTGKLKKALHPYLTRAYLTHPDRQRVANLRAQLSIETGLPWIEPFFDESFAFDALSAVACDQASEVSLSNTYSDRPLLRSLGRELLPQSILNRKDKAAFELGFYQTLREACETTKMEKLVSAKRIRALGLLNPHFNVSSMFEAVRQNQPGSECFWSKLWPILATEEFLQRFETMQDQGLRPPRKS